MDRVDPGPALPALQGGGSEAPPPCRAAGVGAAQGGAWQVWFAAEHLIGPGKLAMAGTVHCQVGARSHVPCRLSVVAPCLAQLLYTNIRHTSQKIMCPNIQFSFQLQFQSL